MLLWFESISFNRVSLFIKVLKTFPKVSQRIASLIACQFTPPLFSKRHKIKEL